MEEIWKDVVGYEGRYSGFRERGGAVIEVSDKNKIELPEE